MDIRIELSDLRMCEETVLATLPYATRQAVLRMYHRPPGREGAVLIVHRDPGRYGHFVGSSRGAVATPILSEAYTPLGSIANDDLGSVQEESSDESFDVFAEDDLGEGMDYGDAPEFTPPPPPPRPVYVIGRSMFETSSLPDGWAEQCNTHVDELWLPSEFNVETFAAHGVQRGRLHVMPQPIDTNLFDVAITKPMELPGKAELRRSSDGQARFAFLSVFKWESRKGWDALLRAYLHEFRYQSDHVALYLRVRTDEANRAELAALLAQEICDIQTGEETVREWGTDAADTTGLLLSCLNVTATAHWPPVILLNEPLPQAELPSLYRAVDAFVLPTRGEGWGRPVMEAMAMGLPTIVTNWSGPTAFITSQTAFPLEYELQQAPAGPHHFWAEPSIPSLRTLMRKVYSREDEVKAAGAAARLHARHFFSQEAVSALLIRRLLHLEPTLVHRRAQHVKERPAQNARRKRRRRRRSRESWGYTEQQLPSGSGTIAWSALDPIKIPEVADGLHRDGSGKSKRHDSFSARLSHHQQASSVPHRVTRAPPNVPLLAGLHPANITFSCSTDTTCCHGLAQAEGRHGSKCERSAFVVVHASEGRALAKQHLASLALTLSTAEETGKAWPVYRVLPERLDAAFRVHRWLFVPMENVSVTHAALCRKSGSLSLRAIKVTLLCAAPGAL